MLSKRVLLRLVTEGHVRGWDDPRMPTISGLRRRGFPAEGIRDFADDDRRRQGRQRHRDRACSSTPSATSSTGRRRGGSRVLDPLKVVIENYPEGQVEEMEVVNNPEDPGAGTRKVPFARELWIERDDFMEDPPPKFFRLAPGREVRLRSAYFVTCTEVVKDAAGSVVELRCTYDPATRGGDAPDGRRPKATLHWLSARTRCRPRSACTTTCSADPTRAPTAATCSPTSTRASETVADERVRRARLVDAPSARPSSSSGWATSRRTRIRRRAGRSSTGR